MSNIFTPWPFIKNLVDNEDHLLQYSEDSKAYYIRTTNAPVIYETEIYKANHGIEGVDDETNDDYRDDFEANYKANANKLFIQKVDVSTSTSIELATASSTLEYANVTKNQSLSTSEYTTVYTYSGNGLIWGLYLELSNTDVAFKMLINDVAIIDVASLLDVPVKTDNCAFMWRGGAGKEFFVEFPLPRIYSTSVKLQLKATNPNTYLVTGYLCISKES